MRRTRRQVICLGLLFTIASTGQAQISTPTPAYSKELVAELIAGAKAKGDARHGAMLFRSPKLACLSCHKVGMVGGIIGPDLGKIGATLTPELLVEGVFWPKRQVKDEYKAHGIVTSDGKVLQGYKESETATELVLRDPPTGKLVHIAKAGHRRTPRNWQPDAGGPGCGHDFGGA